MQTKRIICPKCRTVLDVKNSQNELVKQITCPSCKTILQVKFQPQQEPIEAKTFYATPRRTSPEGGATELSGGSYGATQLAGGSFGATQLVTSPLKDSSKARLLFGSISYPLGEGENIVGRKASTSTASVQIETADRYMSRQHCSIKISTLPDGKKKVVLSNYQNKNQTIVDGQPIDTGDAIRLTDGNSITMGKTTVIFKIS